jgi:hypothetical protein
MGERKSDFDWRCCSSNVTSFSPRPSLLNLDQGQGGAQAVEDAAALGRMLKDVKPEDVAEQLKVVERIRKNRASAITIFSNHAQDEASKIQKEAALYVTGSMPSRVFLTFTLINSKPKGVPGIQLWL